MSAGHGWLVWILAGAVGGLIALVSALAIARASSRRHRAPGAVGAPGIAPDEAIPPPPASQRGAPPSEAPTWVQGASERTRLAAGSNVIGYVTIGDDTTAGDEGESLTAIEATCERHGWTLVEIVRDRREGSSLHRPGLGYALGRIAAGQADALVVRDLERLTRSTVDLGALMAWFQDAGATLIALDLGIDTSTAEGQRVATTLIAISAHERERIAAGTRRGLAEGRAQGRPGGRPAVRDRPDLVERIAAMREAKMSLRAIADELNAEGVPTLRGGKKWRPSSIQAALGYQRPGPITRVPAPRD